MAGGKYTKPEIEYDASSYGTGPTEPPKDNAGTVALLLMLVIFLLGIVTVLGALNVKLFRQLQQEESRIDMSFAVMATEALPIPTEFAPPQELAPPFGIQRSPMSQEAEGEAAPSFQEIYEKNLPSVVSITALHGQSSATGAGVVFDPNGLIVTNAHLVAGAQAIQLQLADERLLEAKLVACDRVSDLAVLKVEAVDLVPAEFGDPSLARVGDSVLVIGDPRSIQFRGSYAEGSLSAVSRDVEVEGDTMRLLQTNVALSAGNSGGPLINRYGQVIGINTRKIERATGAANVQGLGFAVPSTTVQDVTQQLMARGYVAGRPCLGLHGEALLKFDQRYLRLPPGILVTRVEPGSDASAKGVALRDVLLSIDGKPVTTQAELRSALSSRQVGDTVQLVLYRGGQQYRIEVVLTEERG